MNPLRAIAPLIRAWELFILGWALKEISPLHPDVPKIVVRQAQLRSMK
jgi:hypothetical protein